jgi:sporulation protein YlmC with PRC-barrel domain
MLLLSHLIGRPVLGPDGTRLGVVLDLTVDLGGRRPVVRHLVLRRSRRAVRYVPWPQVLIEGRGVRLRTQLDADAGRGTSPAASQVAGSGAGGTAVDAAPPNVVLLARDVLDLQVVDLVGHRAGRVADVLLAPGPAGALEVSAVDLGFGAVCRRLGLGRLAARLPGRIVDWADLHLAGGRGHQLQLSTPTAGVHRLDARGLAHLLARLGPRLGSDVARSVGPRRVAAAVARSHPAVADPLILSLRPGEAADVLGELPPEHRRHYRDVLRRQVLRRRRFRRLHGWRRHRPDGDDPGRPPADPGDDPR